MAVHSLKLKRTSASNVNATLIEHRKGYNVDAVPVTPVVWTQGAELATIPKDALIAALEAAGIIAPDV